MIEQTPEPDLSRPWRVLLTPDTTPAVAAMIEGILSGRTYTTVRAYEYREWEPEVETGQRLEKVTVNQHADGSASILVVDTTSVWGPNAYLDPAEQVRMYLDPCKGEIRYRWTTPEGRGCWVHIAVEQHDEELRTFHADVDKTVQAVLRGELNLDEAISEIGRHLEETGGEG